MESSSATQRSSISDKEFDGLTLNLNPIGDDSQDTKEEGGILEQDIDLLDY